MHEEQKSLKKILSFQVQVGSLDWSEALQPRVRTIVGGDIVAEKSLPWTVALGTADTGVDNFFCGGTLISYRLDEHENNK